MTLSTPIKNFINGTTPRPPMHAAASSTSCPPTNSLDRVQARCGGHRRVFPDGERCFAHWTDVDRAVVADLDARAPGIGLQEREDRELDRYYWPYGLDHRTEPAVRLAEFAEGRQLRLSTAYGHPCPGWLTGGDRFEDCPAEAARTRPDCEHARACPAAWTGHIHAGDRPCPGECWCYVYFTPANHCPGLRGRSAFDHLTVWEGPNGLRVAVGAPYRIGESEAQILAEFNSDPRLNVQVLQPGNGWYHPSTWTVIVAGLAGTQGVAA